MNTQNTFTEQEQTKIYNSLHGWTGRTRVKINGKNWEITTSKHSRGISTHCHAVEDEGNGSISFMMFGGDDKDSFYLNQQPKTTRATEKSITTAHAESLVIFNARKEAGELPKVEESEVIKIGQIIFTDFIHTSDNENRRAIYEINGNNFKSVSLDGSRIETDSHVRPYSKKFGIGVYFNPGETISEEEIKELKAKAVINMAKADEAQSIQDAENKIKSEKKEAYLRNFTQADRRTTTGIIKDHILKTWPEVQKAEIKTEVFSGGDSMHVKYFAASPIKELEAFIDSFKYGYFDSMNDIYNYSDKEEIIMQGHILQTYKYCSTNFEQCEAEEEKTEITPAPAGIIQIIDYSLKAFAVIGETKPIKDKLKEMGGSFNPRLTCGMGWIFPKTRLEEVKNFLTNPIKEILKDEYAEMESFLNSVGTI